MKSVPLVLLISLVLSACAEERPVEPQAVAQPQPETPAANVVADAVPQPLPMAARPAEIPATLKSTEGCALDSVNGQSIVQTATVADNENVQFSGWAGDLDTGNSPEYVYVQLEGPETLFIKASPAGTKRPDVAAHFSKPGLETAGWDANANLSQITAGSYKVRILQVNREAGLSCDSKRSIVIN